MPRHIFQMIFGLLSNRYWTFNPIDVESKLLFNNLAKINSNFLSESQLILRSYVDKRRSTHPKNQRYAKESINASAPALSNKEFVAVFEFFSELRLCNIPAGNLWPIEIYQGQGV